MDAPETRMQTHNDGASKPLFIDPAMNNCHPAGPDSTANGTIAVIDPVSVANNWLTRLSAALSSSSHSALAALFAPPCVLRDSLLFAWDSVAPSFPDSIAAHVLSGLYAKSGGAGGQLSDFELETGEGLAPEVLAFDQPGAVSFTWRFDTKLGKGRAAARLFPPSHYRVLGKRVAGQEDWIADSVHMTLDSLSGHEEALLSQDRNLNLYHGSSWTQKTSDRRKEVEESPDVLIVGAGQTGLMLGAHFGQIGLKALIVEKDARVGDEWRRRYRILALHTPKEHHTLLYAPYPKTWPTFTAKDKLGDWFESYAIAQDLVLWTSTALLSSPAPVYNKDSCTWTVSVGHPDGSVVKTLQVKHVVLATGTIGPPYNPGLTLPGRELFKGRTLHATTFDNGCSFKGEKVLVVGSGNSAADICQDLSQHEVQKIWMLQRSSTFVVLPHAFRAIFADILPPGCDVDLADWKNCAVPWSRRGQLIVEDKARMIKEGLDLDVHPDDVERARKMQERGFMLDRGPDEGIFQVIYTRLGGHLIDAGFSDLLIRGGVEMITNTEIERFTQNGVVMTDGQAIKCDSIIFATGYHPGVVLWRSIFGDEIIDRAGPAWGLDDHKELRGAFRKTGHPGLYYAGGDFTIARCMSRQLGLLILARKLGYDQ